MVRKARHWLGAKVSFRGAMIFMVFVMVALVLLAIFGVIHPSK